MKFKQTVSIMLTCSMLIGFSGCSGKLPQSFPNMNYSTDVQDDENKNIDITPVNFYFDNIENTKAINYNSLIPSSFMQSVISTNRSTFTTTDYHLELKDGKYNIAENEKPLEDLYLSDEFYIDKSNSETRESSGILNLLFNEEEPQIDMDTVNLIFTDLSEKDIDKVARNIRETYLLSEEYNVCVLTVSMQTKEDYQPFYVCTGNNSIIEVNADGLDKRFYYLIMLGPTSEVATYVHCLKVNLNDSRPVENSDYYITDYDYIQHTFSIEDDLNSESISYPDANTAFSALYSVEESTDSEIVLDDTEQDSSAYTSLKASYKNDNEKLFKTNIIRLDDMKDCLKYDIWHLKYNKDNTNGMGLSPKGYGNKSLDFSLQANMDLSFSLSNKDIHYITLDKKGSGSIVYDGFPESGEIDEDDMFFAFGAEEEVEFYRASKDNWELLDSDRVSRFFKEFSTDNGRLSFISDNTDEGNINELYIVIPVYQIVVRKNYTPKWIDNQAYIVGQDFNGLDRYRKTYNLRQFYCLLFGINVENKEGDFYVDENIIERNIIGYARILITDI